jgi:hypothetical protein
MAKILSTSLEKFVYMMVFPFFYVAVQASNLIYGPGEGSMSLR